MRFLAMHRIDEQAPEWDPSPEFIEAMGAFMQQAADAGVLITAEGVHKSDRGALVRHAGGRTTVTDGPFLPAREQLAGFWLWDVKDMDEAVAWVKRCPNPMPEPSEIEIRPLYEMSDLV